MEETNSSSKCCFGSSMDDIYFGHGPWQSEVEPISASRHHTVLYELPANLKSPPKPHVNSKNQQGNNDYVQMPHSSRCLHPVRNESDEETWVSLWELIQASLLQPLNSSQDLENAINKYNFRLPRFLALHNFFENVLDEEESNQFFQILLPEIIRLALQLPNIVPGNIPLLKRGIAKSLSFSQYQISCLLANAFLCTFPTNKERSQTYPGINFTRLFASHSRPNRIQAVSEKLKCICNYFRKIFISKPVGVITFERKYLNKHQCPRWDRVDNNLGNTKIRVSSKGVIEDNGDGLLQVDFANKYVGGGVLSFGCVQEEIRYVICPELIASRLFTEELGSTEALVITGAERYSSYTGYGNSFTWSGDYDDTTPHDSWGRRRTNIVAIDALSFSKPSQQFHSSAILRELNKAYVGFHSYSTKQLPGVATGNWGCGAFCGDPNLKFLIQLMACSINKRNMVYFTFDDVDLRDRIYNIYLFLATNKVTICQLWRYLCQFSNTQLKIDKLYSFIQQAHFDNKGVVSVKNYFIKKKPEDNPPSTSSSSNFARTFSSSNAQAEPEDELCVIDSSQNETEAPKTLIQLVSERSKKEKLNKTDVSAVINLIDEGVKKIYKCEEERDSFSLLSAIDDFSKKLIGDSVKVNCEEKYAEDMEVDEQVEKSDKNLNKRKITDYFVKIDKG